MTTQLTIGQLAELTRVPTKTIRYYEQSGILPTPRRSDSNYRLYSETDVRRLELIRRARLLDMTLPGSAGARGAGQQRDLQRFSGTLFRGGAGKA